MQFLDRLVLAITHGMRSVFSCWVSQFHQIFISAPLKTWPPRGGGVPSQTHPPNPLDLPTHPPPPPLKGAL